MEVLFWGDPRQWGQTAHLLSLVKNTTIGFLLEQGFYDLTTNKLLSVQQLTDKSISVSSTTGEVRSIRFDCLCANYAEYNSVVNLLETRNFDFNSDNIIFFRQSMTVNAKNITANTQLIKEMNYLELFNNTITFDDCSLNNVSFSFAGGVNNRVYIKKNATLNNCTFYITGSNHEVCIDEDCYINDSGFYFHHVCRECQTVLGKQTTVNGALFEHADDGTRIVLGTDCMLSTGIDFMTSDTHSVIDKDTKKRINQGRDIIFGDHVWVGKNVLVLKGVTVGNDSILGMGSVVTKRVPANVVIGGNPAKITKTNVSWSRDLIK